MKILIFLLLLVTLIHGFCFAQVKFQLKVGGASDDFGQSVFQAYDGAYFVAGYTNSFGTGQNDIYLVKISESGSLVWTKTFGLSGNEYAYSIIQTVDSGFAIAGYTTAYGSGGGDFLIIKITKNGSTQWIKQIGGLSTEFAYDIIQTIDNGLIIAGTSSSFGGTFPYIVKLDVNGSFEYSKTVTAGGLGIIYSITQTNDSGFAFTGLSLNGVYTVKLDKNLSLQWSSIYHQGGYSDRGRTIIQTADSGYAVAGEAATGFNYRADYYILKYSKNGSLEWNRIIGEVSGQDIPVDLIQSPDGGFITVGSTNSYSQNSQPDGFIVKISGSGIVEWNKIIGSSGWEVIYSLCKTADNGFVLIGGASSGSYSDVYIVKLDNNWNSCGYSNDTSVSIGTWGNLISHSTTVTPQSPNVTSPILEAGTGGMLTVSCILLGSKHNSNDIPSSFMLNQNYPNPFNPTTKIKFSIPAPSPLERAGVRLIIYDILGREVATLVNEQLRPGTYEVEWDGSNYSSGVYYYSLISRNYTETKKMILMK